VSAEQGPAAGTSLVKLKIAVLVAAAKVTVPIETPFFPTTRSA
jgi:hypothetical protein